MNTTHSTSELRWPEIYSLAALSAAVAISWIAYHEYQPHLLEKFNFRDLAVFLIIAKGVVLVLIPPLAGLVADMIIKRSGKFFLIFSVGIGATAMVFMVVASILAAGPLNQIKAFLPYMIVLWLVTMNIFVSPAISMINSFAPTKKLPVVMGFLFLVTELIYALEPLVVELVQFFGDTLTFVVGGVLIAGTGYLFQRVSSDEVATRQTQMGDQAMGAATPTSYLAIIMVGILLGVGKAFLVEYVPEKVASSFSASALVGGYLSFGLLGFAAILAFAVSGYVSRIGFSKVLPYGLLGIVISLAALLMSPSLGLFAAAGVFLAGAFGLVNVCALPYAISRLSVLNITLGVGIFLGASEIAGGILEYVYK